MIDLMFLMVLMLIRQSFQPSVCNEYYNVQIMCTGISSIAILNIHDVCYCCIIVKITKYQAINLLRNAHLS